MNEENKSQDPIIDPTEREYQEKVLNPLSSSNPTLNKNSIPEYAKDNIKGVTDELSEEFDVKHIGDLSYLLEIFSSKYDKYQSLEYLKKTRQSMLNDGYSDNSLLNEFLFWATMSRKMQIVYQRMHAKLNQKKSAREDDTENLTFLKEMRAVSAQVSSLQSLLDGALDKRKKVKDVVDLHAETIKNAEEFIKSHIGEFEFMCHKCGSVVNSQGLPHFAIMTEKNDKNEVVYYVFSPELWFLYKRQIVTLAQAAFILRTSPEGVLLTAEQRHEHGAATLRENSVMVEEQEGALKKLVKEYHARLEDK